MVPVLGEQQALQRAPRWTLRALGRLRNNDARASPGRRLQLHPEPNLLPSLHHQRLRLHRAHLPLHPSLLPKSITATMGAAFQSHAAGGCVLSVE